MFSSIKPPEPEREDWTDTLVNRGLPLLGGLAGAALAVPTGGASLAALPAIMGGASAGMGAGQMLGSFFQDRPGVGQQQFGQGVQNLGHGLGGMYQSNQAEQWNAKQAQTEANKKPNLQMGALPHQTYQSKRAQEFAGKKGY